jgi:hypothetical protein
VMIYLQSVRGLSAISASVFLIPLAVAMTAGGLAISRLMARGWSARTVLLTGEGIVTVALVLMAMTEPGTPLLAMRGELTLLGAGLSMLIGQYVLVVQRAAPRHQLGVAMTSLRLFQTLGGAIGATLFGTLLNRVFAAAEPHVPAGALATLSGAARLPAATAFAHGLDAVFGSAAALMVVAILATSRLREAR